MKKELREEVKRDQTEEQKGKLTKLIDDNKGVVKALGIASFLALAGYSASQLLKDKKLMKKIQDGIKSPKGLKYLEKFFNNSGTNKKEKIKDTLSKGSAVEKQETSVKKSGTTNESKSESKKPENKAEAKPEPVAKEKPEAKTELKPQAKPQSKQGVKPEAKTATKGARTAKKADTPDAKPKAPAKGGTKSGNASKGKK